MAEIETLDYESLKLAQYEYWSVFLHEDQSYLGRNYVALNRGGDNEELDPFVDTTSEERDEFTVIVTGIKSVLEQLYQPTRINYANLRNTWNHCHWHVIPRYEGQDNGLRTVAGYAFTDLNAGKNYAPSPKVELPQMVLEIIKTNISGALSSLY